MQATPYTSLQGKTSKLMTFGIKDFYFFKYLLFILLVWLSSCSSPEQICTESEASECNPGFGDHQMAYTPATRGEDYDGPRTAFERGLYSSNGCDLGGVGGKRSEATQLLKKLLMENGCLCLPADLSE